MSDEPKAAEAAAPDLDKLQAERDALKARLEEAERRAAEAESKKNEAIESRQKAKERERKEAEARGEYEKVLSEIRAENEEKAARLAQYEAERADLLAAKEAWEKAREEQRAELIARLPEDKREEAKGRSLEELKFAVSLLPANGGSPVVHKGGGAPVNGGAPVKWSEMSTEQKLAYAATHTQSEIAAAQRRG